MASELKYISDAALQELNASIEKNLDRYTGEGFADFLSLPSWDISLKIEFDESQLGKLDHTRQQNIVEIDRANSEIVGKALGELTPSLANEEKIWVRLAHIEAFEYCRTRWLEELDGQSLIDSIRTHFFAPTQTGIRDDHALSRLWWNYQIAKTCMPDNPENALQLFMQTADIRSNFVERIWLSSRKNIAGAVLRAMNSNPKVTESEKHFREFMKTVNKNGGGIVFEILNDNEADSFVNSCIEQLRDGSA